MRLNVKLSSVDESHNHKQWRINNASTEKMRSNTITSFLKLHEEHKNCSHVELESPSDPALVFRWFHSFQFTVVFQYLIWLIGLKNGKLMISCTTRDSILTSIQTLKLIFSDFYLSTFSSNFPKKLSMVTKYKISSPFM